MHVLTLIELMRMAKIEPCDLLTRIASKLTHFSEGAVVVGMTGN